MHAPFRIAVYMLLAAFGTAMLCCKKPAFHSGVGLYSTKQYHSYIISSGGDTGKLGDVKISTVAEDNNYVLWNNIDFHMYYSTDSLVTYIKDSILNGNYTIVYTLQYLPKTDQVHVQDHVDSKIWLSF